MIRTLHSFHLNYHVHGIHLNKHSIKTFIDKLTCHMPFKMANKATARKSLLLLRKKWRQQCVQKHWSQMDAVFRNWTELKCLENTWCLVSKRVKGKYVKAYLEKCLWSIQVFCGVYKPTPLFPAKTWDAAALVDSKVESVWYTSDSGFKTSIVVST